MAAGGNIAATEDGPATGAIAATVLSVVSCTSCAGTRAASGPRLESSNVGS